MQSLGKYAPYALAVLRIVTALLFIEHGTAKLFGFPAMPGTDHAGGSLPPLILIAALLEVFGGLAILVGFFTRPVAFILSGDDGRGLLDGACAEGRLLSTIERRRCSGAVLLHLLVSGVRRAWSVEQRRQDRLNPAYSMT